MLENLLYKFLKKNGLASHKLDLVAKRYHNHKKDASGMVSAIEVQQQHFTVTK